MQKINKSEAASVPNFEVEVARFVSLKKEFREHQAKVEADERNGVTGIAKHVACKPPIAHRLIESAIDADGNASYEIVDDGPTAAKQLEAKKALFEGQLAVAQALAVEAVFPRRQAPMLQIRETEIHTAQRQRMITHQKSFIKSVLTSPPEMPEQDKVFVDLQQSKRDQIANIQRITAQALADIDGLTAENIDAWKLPSFS